MGKLQHHAMCRAQKYFTLTWSANLPKHEPLPWSAYEIQTNGTQKVVLQLQSGKENKCRSWDKNPKNLDVVHLLDVVSLEIVLIIWVFLQICLNNNKIVHHWKGGANFIYSFFLAWLHTPKN